MARVAMQFKAITPKAMNVGAVLREVRQALQEEGDIERRMLEKTVRTWRHRVEFSVRVDMSRNDVNVKIGTDDDIYNWVSNGVRRRRIYARRARFLRFGHPSTPKTHVRVIGSGAGSTGNTIVYAKSVNWPGIKARRFYEEVSKRRKPLFVKKMQAAITRGLR